MTSSFSIPLPSRATIKLSDPKQDRAIWLSHLFGLLGVCLLILMGGSHNVYVSGAALLLPGIALVFQPPRQSPGKWVDIGILGFLGSLLFAFIPLFYWSTPGWREAAVSAFGIDLPSILSVQPRISFEAWLMVVAGFAWFYAASGWRINSAGRKWLMAALAGVVAVFSAWVIWGNLHGLRYPGAEDSRTFSFFPNRNQTANFLAIGGIVSFGFAMEGLRGRKAIHLIGLLASGLCLGALLLGASRAGLLLYFLGVLIWFLARLRATSIPVFFKVGFPLVLLAFSFFISSNEQATARVVDFFATPFDWSGEYRALVYRDTVKMIGDAPITGIGIGNFSAVFPQYRELSRNFQQVMHPESDFFWLAAEGGLVAVVFFVWFLAAYFIRCRGLSLGRSGSFRVIALVAVVVFLLHGLVDVSGHRPGTVYFALLFAALALPRTKHPQQTLRPVIWRGIGGFLIVFGAAWIFSGFTRLPLHLNTELRRQWGRAESFVKAGDYESATHAMDQILAERPLDAKAYFQRAQYTLAESGQLSEAAADFRRARFVEPVLGELAYREGFVWLPYDAGRTISAWREALFGELEDRDKTFSNMLNTAVRNPELMDGLLGLSEFDPYYRWRVLTFLKGERFMAELHQELAADPELGRFDRKQRTAIVHRWILYGDRPEAEAYLEAHASAVDSPLWLWAVLRKEQANFDEAVTFARKALSVPALPEVTLDEKALLRLVREFAVMPQDLVKGTALLRVYLDEGQLKEALGVTDKLIQLRNPPGYVFYWRAEIFYRMNDSIESWYAFQAYVDRMKVPD